MYEVDYWTDDVAATIEALPRPLLAEFLELRTALELSPWTVGMPFSEDDPAIPSRTATVGRGAVLILFGIRESDARVVTIVDVIFA